MRLPAAYVASHVDLAYAETSHANQGRTVDRSLLYLDGPAGASGVYVPLTRGRESNDAYVAVQGLETPADVLAEALSRTWVDRPAVAVRAELRAEPPSSGGEAASFLMAPSCGASWSGRQRSGGAWPAPGTSRAVHRPPTSG